MIDEVEGICRVAGIDAVHRADGILGIHGKVNNDHGVILCGFPRYYEHRGVARFLLIHVILMVGLYCVEC